MIIKYATEQDITAIAAVQAKCFPPAEPATEKEFIERIKRASHVCTIQVTDMGLLIKYENKSEFV